VGLINLNFFIINIATKKMEVNNHGLIIYPQNIKKYTGFIQEVRSKSINGNNKVLSFGVRIGRRGTVQLGVYLNKNQFVTSWADEFGVQKKCILVLINLGMKLQKTWP